MMRQLVTMLLAAQIFTPFSLYAGNQGTIRHPILENSDVAVWETVIAPGKNQKLAFHRHERNRILVALDDGILQVTEASGKSHLLHLKKDNAYFLAKDVPGRFHTDENLCTRQIRTIVIELKK